MRLICGLSALMLWGATVAAPAQDFSAERLSEGVRVISADEFQGRYPGTVGEDLTLAWLQAQYESLGLEPGGPDGQWLQVVDLQRYTPAGAPSLNWIGPDGQIQVLRSGEDFFLRAAFNDGRASLQDAPVVFAGYGIVAPERGWDDYGDLDVRGKVVLVLNGEPEGELFNGAYPTVYNAGWRKANEAFNQGAVGVISITALDAGDPRWLGQGRFADRTRTLTPGAGDLEFNGSINRDVATRLMAAGGLDRQALTEAAGTGTFKAVELAGVRLFVHAAETIETLRTHNLLARIPGTDRPDETIIFSAHWDHVGVVANPAPGADAIFNGAWDNASGTVAVVEMARALAAAPPPERSIVFAHMTAEEMGLLGAYWYTAHPVWPLETTVANINIDMLPLSAPTRDLPIFGYGQNTLEDDLKVLAAAEGRMVTDDGQPEQGFYYRSDHFPFALAGVPALMPWHGVDLVEGGREVGLPAYRAKFAADYHRVTDEWSEDLDFSSAVENLTLLYRLALDLANSDRWPDWKPTSEFAATRAESDAARRATQ